ncbi:MULTISPECIES: TetR/AcrR family transcriptional regulator [Acidobacterium]|uniref:TetR/AcrR family transcriptional regulator n=1 Tax=Acidobacterium TaxID=33973 RepID=UPI00145EE425|nr:MULTISPECIES: TetR/AcrR family transcriptional regulator [Acidobacterium]
MAYPAKTDRESILAAALEQVESDGLDGLAIRSLAAKLELTPNALYRYFENLSALEFAVAEEVRIQMLEVMQRVIGRKGPSESIRAISEAYLRFAQERPRAFALYLKNSASQTPQCARNTEFFIQQVARVYGKERAQMASHALWAQIHGLAVLLGAGVLPREEAHVRLKFALKIWIDGATAP